MDINKLYEELGRSTAQLSETIKHGDEQDARHKVERAAHHKKLDEVHARIRLLSEAVVLSKSGIDPTIAKLTADSSLEEQDANIAANASRGGLRSLVALSKKHKLREAITSAITPVEEIGEDDGD